MKYSILISTVADNIIKRTKYSLLLSAVVLGISIVFTSCKKSEEVQVEMVEELQYSSTGQRGLAKTMKGASLVMRRLSRAVKNNDWVEMEMWTQELKEGIGFNCVTLYMIENAGFPFEFIVLSHKFNNAINKLILCTKKHDVDNTNLEFSNLVKSCDECHERLNEDMEEQLDFTK